MENIDILNFSMQKTLSFVIGGKKMTEQNTIEDKLKDTLSGDLLTNALDLVDYLKKNEMSNGTEPGDTRFYYKGELMCILIFFKDENHPSGGGLMIFDCPLTEHEDFSIDKSVKEFVWDNIHNCGSCGGSCDHKERGATKVVFGKEYENLCSSEIAFFDPDAEAIVKIKKLMDLWKFKIDNIPGYSSHDR